MERQRFDNALASAKDQMVRNVEVVCVLFLLTVSLNLNSSASKSVSLPTHHRLLKLSVTVLYDTGYVLNGLLFYSDSTVIVSLSNHNDPPHTLSSSQPPVSALNTTSLEKSFQSPFYHAGNDRFLYIRP